MSTRVMTAVVILCAVLGTAYASPPLEAYGRLPAVELMRLSPSGDRYAFIAVAGEGRKLTVVSYEGKPQISADVGSSKVRDIQWVGDNHVLVTTTSTFSAPIYLRQSYELASVLNINVDRRTVNVIFAKAPGIAHAVFGDFGSAKVEGHLFGYFGGVTLEHSGDGEMLYRHGYRDLYRVDLDSDQTTLEARGSERTHSWVIAADGTAVARSEYGQSVGRWRLFSSRPSDKLLMDRESPLNSIRLLGQGRTDGTVLVMDASGDRDELLEISVADGKQEELLSNMAVRERLYDPETHQLIGVLTKGEPLAYFFDNAMQARFNGARKAFPGLRVRLESFSRYLNRLIVETEGGDDSGTFWLVDIATGKADPIGQAYPTIRSADVGATRVVQYSVEDGFAIEALLTLPPGRNPQKNLPLVVLPYVGPIDVTDTVGFSWWAQAYASRGYAVLQPNYRGSGDVREVRKAGLGLWGRKIPTDLSDGVVALAKDGVVDPKRVCIVGAAWGGYAAFAGVTLQRGVYRCAVAIAGVSDLTALLNWQVERFGSDSDVMRSWRAFIGVDKEGSADMRSLSPAFSAENADAPILLIHGKDDTIVPIEQSERMASVLKHANKPFEFQVMEGEDHWLSRQESRITMLKAAVAFVEKYNPPDALVDGTR